MFFEVKKSYYLGHKKNTMFFIKKILLTLKSKNYGFKKIKGSRFEQKRNEED